MMVKNAKYLGVTLDESLSFDCHIKNLTKRLLQSIGILAKVKQFLNTVTNNNFVCQRYDYLLHFNAYSTDLLILPLFFLFRIFEIFQMIPF